MSALLEFRAGCNLVLCQWSRLGLRVAMPGSHNPVASVIPDGARRSMETVLCGNQRAIRKCALPGSLFASKDLLFVPKGNTTRFEQCFARYYRRVEQIIDTVQAHWTEWTMAARKQLDELASRLHECYLRSEEAMRNDLLKVFSDVVTKGPRIGLPSYSYITLESAQITKAAGYRCFDDCLSSFVNRSYDAALVCLKRDLQKVIDACELLALEDPLRMNKSRVSVIRNTPMECWFQIAESYGQPDFARLVNQLRHPWWVVQRTRVSCISAARPQEILRTVLLAFGKACRAVQQELPHLGGTVPLIGAVST